MPGRTLSGDLYAFVWASLYQKFEVDAAEKVVGSWSPVEWKWRTAIKVQVTTIGLVFVLVIWSIVVKAVVIWTFEAMWLYILPSFTLEADRFPVSNQNVSLDN